MSPAEPSREQLERLLIDSVGWAAVTTVATDLYSVLLPSTRYIHDKTQVTVQRTDAGWRLTDAGEIAATFGADLDNVVDLLRCAGADLFFDKASGLATAEFEADMELSSLVIEFAHYVAAAPLMWRAHNCALHDDLAEEHVIDEPLTKALARETKTELVRRCGRPFSTLIRLDRRLIGPAGMRARMPLCVSTSKTSSPRLIAACIDTTAAPQATSANS